MSAAAPETYPAIRYVIERPLLAGPHRGDVFIDGVARHRDAYRKRLATVVGRFGHRCDVVAFAVLIDDRGRWLRHRRIYPPRVAP